MITLPGTQGVKKGMVDADSIIQEIPVILGTCEAFHVWVFTKGLLP